MGEVMLHLDVYQANNDLTTYTVKLRDILV